VKEKGAERSRNGASGNVNGSGGTMWKRLREDVMHWTPCKDDEGRVGWVVLDYCAEVLMREQEA